MTTEEAWWDIVARFIVAISKDEQLGMLMDKLYPLNGPNCSFMN